MNKITVDPCNVCGSTDVNLVDGFYYCVECGTQDVNVRESMVIERKDLGDGTFTVRQKQRVFTVLEDKNEMSGEWHKWHAYNFILVGLADELIAAGARQSFKMKVLWLWTEYIKKFQNKEELGLSIEESRGELNEKTVRNKKTQMKMTKDVAVVKKSLLFSMLYVALNLDGSDIQISDLLRFIREGRLDMKNCKKYVPKEIKVDLIPGWKTFDRSLCVFNRDVLLTSISLLNCLGIPPRLPDLRKLVDRYVKELCLPYHFKTLVLALMQLAPCKYLDIDIHQMKTMVRLPAYECVVMSYFLVAFKMCFGLDDDYEIKLSDTVDKINSDNYYLKSYKLGALSEPTDRLFSFREWCNYIQLRKIILSKYNLHMAEEFLHEIDDYVYMEHTHEKTIRKSKSLTDDIIMKMLGKLPLVSEVEVIPKSEFKPTTTPLSTYTELVMQYFNDPDLKLLFCEDFTQYSLKYAVETLYLLDNENVRRSLHGINETNKLLKSDIIGILEANVLDVEIVYVRNCENKNWLKTNQPTAEHIKKINESNNSDKCSDHGYDSNLETVSSETEFNSKESSDIILDDQIETEKKLILIEEENWDTNIFDDDFEDIKEIEVKAEENEQHTQENIECGNSDIQTNDIQNNDVLEGDDFNSLYFNPNTFDREKTIRELVLACCKKYKINIPKEYDNKKPKKRKASFLKDKTGESRGKRPRVSNPNRNKPAKPSTVRDEINELIASYFKNLEHDILYQISEQVRSVINKANDTQESQNTDMSAGENPPDVLVDMSIDNAADKETSENIEINSQTLDSSSVQCVDEQNVTNDKTCGDPNFDENEYDIKQLYVKIKDEDDLDDVFNIADDPEISEILERKIGEVDKIEMAKKLPHPKRLYKVKATDDDDDDDDDIPLSVLREEKMINRSKENVAPMQLEPLVKNSSEIKEFKYWIREYTSTYLLKTHDMNEVFHKELNKNYPKSFYFVIRECATMLEITPFLLYKAMLNLEQRLFLSR